MPIAAPALDNLRSSKISRTLASINRWSAIGIIATTAANSFPVVFGFRGMPCIEEFGVTPPLLAASLHFGAPNDANRRPLLEPH